MATFMERVAFVPKIPTLMKATSDDENPCPGYLFQEIGKISHESAGCGQFLLEYLLERLQVDSCHVKIKVLKIFVHLCAHGSHHFLTELRRNSTFIQQASVYSGPADPIHGTALFQKVRNTAQEVGRLLFTDAMLEKSPGSQSCAAAQATGMGSEATHRTAMQGFGCSPGKQGAASSSSSSLLDKIQHAAGVVASAVLPPHEQQGIRLHDNHYRAVAAPPTPIEVAVQACAYELPARGASGTQRCPGQVGGGWEEMDSSHCSSHNSSQGVAANSRASVGRSSKSGGTGSQSGGSRESSGDLSDRVEAMQSGDCGQEMALISRLTEGSRVFLTREESQYFIKECSTLNCEVVVELLSRQLQEPSHTVQMRALCAVACFLTSDLLSLEQIYSATHRRLSKLSEGPAGPLTNKATKISRQLEAMLGGAGRVPRQDVAASDHLGSEEQLFNSAFPAAPPPPAAGLSAGLSRLHGSRETPLPSGGPSTDVPEQPSPSGPDRARSPPSVHGETPRSPVEESGDSRAEEDSAGRSVRPGGGGGGGSGSSPASEPPCAGRLSLFRGMELVARPGAPSVPPETDPGDAAGLRHAGGSPDTDDCYSQTLPNSAGSRFSKTSDAASQSSQAVSAFSFLNC